MGGADNDSWYKAKFNEMMMTSQRSGNELAGAKDEVKKARAKYAELQKEIMALRAHNAALLERVAALEAELDEQAKLHRLAIDERDAEIEKLRAQLAAQILELKELMDSKLALDAEIAITECCPEGEFVLLENKKGKDQNLEGFGIRRKVDLDNDIFFKFPVGFVIPSGSTVKVWSDVNNAVDNAPFQIVWRGTRSWGVGSNILTTLVSPDGEDKSTHKQTTVTESA